MRDVGGIPGLHIALDCFSEDVERRCFESEGIHVTAAAKRAKAEEQRARAEKAAKERENLAEARKREAAAREAKQREKMARAKAELGR